MVVQTVGKKNNLIEYKGYFGSVDYSAEDNILFGSVIDIRGLISYEGKSVDDLKINFEQAIDKYLKTCEANGVEPEKYYKGTLSIRLDPELHRQATIAAASNHETLNEFIKRCVWEGVASIKQ